MFSSVWQWTLKLFYNLYNESLAILDNIFDFYTTPVVEPVVGGCDGLVIKSKALRNICLRTKSDAAEFKFVVDP